MPERARSAFVVAQCTIARSLTGQHALDGLLCQALGILEFLDCHRASELNIGVDDRRTHISRPVALDPAMLCEVETIQLDSKELHPAKPRTSAFLQIPGHGLHSCIQHVND